MASAAFEDIVEDFAFLDDWEDRYRHVIELGRDMEGLDPAFQVAATRVDGCASQVWIHPQIAGTGRDAVFSARGDSDAMIVRGLIAVILALYDGLTIDAVLDTDAHAELGRLGLDEHLSAQRSNGVRAMIERVHAVAAAHLA